MCDDKYLLNLDHLRPYRVRLSVVYEYVTIAEFHADAVSKEATKEPLEYESQCMMEVEAEETDLNSLPPGWDEECLVYGPLENFSVRDVREALAERAAKALTVGDRVYDRRLDLFGRLQSITVVPDDMVRADCLARVKYEYPMSPDAEPREVRLGELIAASKVGG